MLRSVLAVVTGIIVGGLVIYLIEFVISPMIFPLPEGLDITDPQALAAMMTEIPFGAKVLVIVAWALGAMCGGWVAAKVTLENANPVGLIVGVFFLGSVLSNLVMIPHPIWMTVLGLVIPIPAAFIGARAAAMPSLQEPG